MIVRFETPPGKQMQADFTWVRRGRDPLVALAATLGYSRATFVKFGQKEDVTALCERLREALDYFGGVPEQILFDNAKTVVIERDAHGSVTSLERSAARIGRGLWLHAPPVPCVR